jgi:predicted DCC family thiol-disulfide oxidoreductase YuxK
VPSKYTLVYDGDCRICARIVAVIDRWDAAGEVERVPYQSPGIIERFPWIPMESFVKAMQLVGPGRQTWEGAGAVEKLLTVLPRGRWIAWIFHVPLARALADRAYRWVARNRYRLGCGDHCST